MNFKLIAVYSPWFYLLSILLGLIYAFLLYYKYNRFDDINRLKLGILFLMRFISISFLAFLLMSPLINSWRNKKEKPGVLFVFDNSKSITNQVDTQLFYKKYLPQINILQKELSRKYNVRNYLFGQNFRKGTNPDFTDTYTNFSSMIKNVNDLYYKRNIGAVVLVTDGNNNYGANPVYTAMNLNFPIYSIALGDTIQKPDLIVYNTESNDIAFLGDNFPLRINIQAIKLINKKCSLQIFNNGKTVYNEEINITSQNQVFEKNIFIKASQAGLQKYVVKLLPVADEKNTKNNAGEFVIEVLNSRKKILILYNSPHPDVSAIYNSLSSNKNIEISKLNINDDLSEIDRYNLIIAHQIPSKLNRANNLIKKINKLEIPVLYIVGQQTDFKALNSYLDVFKKDNLNNNDFEELYPYYNDKFNLFKLSPGLIELATNLPPLLCPFNTTVQSLATETLYFQKNKNIVTDNPLIAFFSSRKNKFGVITGEGIWRWKIYDYKLNDNNILFNELINKMVQYLSVETKKQHFYVHVQKSYTENQQVIFNAEVYNKSFELINDPEILLQIVDEQGHKLNYNFVKTNNKYSLNAGEFKSGNYQYNAQVVYGNEKYSQKGVFTVSPVNIEYLKSSSDYYLLNQLAVQTGGKYYTVDEIDKLQNNILSNSIIKSSVYKDNNYISLINLKWLFIAILLLLTTEWFLRKYFGSI